MFCKFCGTKLDDNARFCPNCGNAVAPGSNAEQQPGDPAYNQQGSYQQPNYNQYGAPCPPQSGMIPMKWYKFVIWVQLLLSIVLNLVNAFLMTQGTQYGLDDRSELQIIYAVFGGLQALDMVMIVVSVCLAAFAFFVRQKLAHFRRGAPKLYLILLGLTSGVNFLYCLLASLISGVNCFSSSYISNILVSVVMIAVNYTYFKKREFLFCQ